MATAPLVAGWQRRMRSTPGPLAGGTPAAGVPFLQRSAAFAAMYPDARLIVRFAWGADLTADPATWDWTDVTTDLQQGNGQTINIAPMGRSDAVTRTQPAACGFQLDNTSGDYSRGPQSRRYPNVRQNIPVQVLVTLTGAINDAQVRFQGEAWSLRPGWNLRGNVAVVTVSASGKMRQLTQGTPPVHSALFRTNMAAAPGAYWPLEDASGATQAGAATANTSPLRVIGPVKFAPTGTEIPRVLGAANVVDLRGDGTNFAKLTGQVYTSAFSASAWQLEFVGGYASTGSTANIAIAVFTDKTTTPLNFVMTAPTLRDGNAHHLAFQLSQVGPDIQIDIYYDGVFDHSATVPAVILGRPTAVTLNPQGALGDDVPILTSVALFPTLTSPATRAAAVNGFNGEAVTDRLTRLCAEAGIPIDVIGTSSATMGPQGVDTLPNLLREGETADLGLLGDGRGPGLYFITRAARYNQPASMVLNAAAGDLADAPQPEDDDQKLRNQYVVKRKNGSSATYADASGPLGTNTVGTYESTPGADLNLSSDTPLRNIAAWLVGLGTVDGYRYPTTSLDLRNIPGKAGAWAGLRPGGRLQVANVAAVSPQHPADLVDVLAEGWSEQLSPFIWTAVLNCSPARPWDVAALGTSFRLEMAGQTLAASLAPGATSLSLATAAGHALVSTSAVYPADYPTDLVVAGWRVHVTDAAGGTSPQTLTCDPTPNTAVIPAGTPVTLWRPAGLAL